MKKDLPVQRNSVNWVEKLAQQDWSAFQNGDLGCIVAVARKRLWDELTTACEEIVSSYEQEYLRRLFWTTEPSGTARGHSPEKTIHKAAIVEKGTPDRILFELRFDTDLPAIYFCATDPFETSGIIMLVLDEENDVRLCYRGVLMQPAEVAKTLLAPVLFRVNSYHPELKDDLVDLSRLRGAYGEGSLLGRRALPGSNASCSRSPFRSAPEIGLTDRRPAWLAALDVTKPNWLRYVLAAVTVLIATGLIFLFQSLTTVPIYWLVSGAVIFAFVQWGAGPGTVSLLIAIFNTDYFFLDPLWEFNFDSSTRLMGLAYALMAFSAYWLSDRRRAAAHPESR